MLNKRYVDRHSSCLQNSGLDLSKISAALPLGRGGAQESTALASFAILGNFDQTNGGHSKRDLFVFTTPLAPSS